MVTTDTAQTITGAKTFSSAVNLDNVHIKNGNSIYDNYTEINSYGVIKLTDDNGNLDSVLKLPHTGIISSPNDKEPEMIATENWVGSKYQPKLTAGTGISIINNVISATDGGSGGSGGSIPSNMVTTDTYQYITGSKSFSGSVDLNIASIVSLKNKIHIVNNDSDKYIDINSLGKITLADSAGNIDGVLNLPHTGTDSSPKTIAVTSDIPTTTSALTNDSGFITNAALTGYATED